MNNQVKCVTCQRSYDSTKFSVDCPHDVELSADLQRSSQPRPPVSVPPYSPARVKSITAPGGEGHPWEKQKDAASVAKEMTALAGYPICGDVKVSPEDITEEMLDEWLAKRVRATPINDYTKSYCSEVERSLMAAAINIYSFSWVHREHTAESINLDL